MGTLRATFAAFCLSASLHLASSAADTPAKTPVLPDEVVPKQDALKRGVPFAVYFVARVDGERIQLEGIATSLRKDEVMTVPQAIEIYTEVIRAAPSVSAHWNQASLYTHRREFDRALADYDAVIRLDPLNQPNAFANRASVWAQKREFKRAIDDYSQAIRLAPRRAPVFSTARASGPISAIPPRPWPISTSRSAWILPTPSSSTIGASSGGRTGSSTRRWTISAKRSGSTPSMSGLSATGQALGATRRSTTRRCGTQARRCASTPGAPWPSRIWFKKREYEKALADFQAAVRLDPLHDEAYLGLALLWATSPDAKYRDGKKAVGYATRAGELGNWRHVPHLKTLAAACAESGDFAKAVEWQRKANEHCTGVHAQDEGRRFLELYESKKTFLDEG